MHLGFEAGAGQSLSAFFMRVPESDRTGCVRNCAEKLVRLRGRPIPSIFVRPIASSQQQCIFSRLILFPPEGGFDMTNRQNDCPICCSVAVTLRSERKRYGAGSIIEGHLSLVPIAADRTYSCSECDFVFTNTESLQDELQDCLSA
jgi:hypothetical protein